MRLIEELAQHGIKVQLVDSKHLKLTPKHRLTPELIEKVREKKQEIIQALSNGDFMTIRVFSRVLNREVFVSWQGEDPQEIYADGVKYTAEEIDRIGEMPLSRDDLRVIHWVKKEFEGKISTHNPCATPLGESEGKIRGKPTPSVVGGGHLQ